MDPIQLPEDLTSISEADLAELASSVSTRTTELRAQAEAEGEDLTAETVEALEAHGQVVAAVDAEQARRTDAPPAEPTPAAEPAAPAEGASLADRGAAALAALTPAEPAPAEPAPAAEPAEPAAPAAEPGGGGEGGEPTPVAPAAPTATGPGAMTVPSSVSAATAPTAPQEFMRASRYVPTARGNAGPGIEAGQALNGRYDVALAVNQALNQWTGSQIPAATRDFVSLAEASWSETDGVQRITSAEAEDTLLPLTLGVAEAQQSLVAAGVCCTPLSPMYDFCRLAVPQNPVESCLPSVLAPRGGVRHLVTPDWRQAFAAVDEQCCGDNDDPGNPVLKACSRVECPEEDTCTVCAISWCAEFDNLQSRTFPELIDNYLEDLAVAYAIRKEVHYLDFIHDASTAVTGVDTGYGALRQFLYNLGLAAVGYRKRNRMRDGAMLNALVPSWVRDVIKAVIMLQADRNGTSICPSDAEVNAAFTCWGISPCWYVDSATGQDQAFDGTQAAGPLNAWPDEALVYLFSPGTFVRLDGGTLDIGLIRDSQLTRRNDFQMFFEEWIGMCQLCPESIALTVPFCVNGAAPDVVAALACA